MSKQRFTPLQRAHIRMMEALICQRPDLVGEQLKKIKAIKKKTKPK